MRNLERCTRFSLVSVAGLIALAACGQGPDAPVDSSRSVDQGIGVANEAFPDERSEVQRGPLTIAGETRTASYEILHNEILVEGDMVIGRADPTVPEVPVSEESADPPEDLLAVEEAVEAPSAAGGSSDPLVTDTGAVYWPGGVVRYTVDKNLPDQGRVWDAMRRWHDHTHVRFARKKTQKNFVTFTTGSGCSSYVGMIGGRQYVNLAADCTTVSVMHEIGHTVGLEHEQSRLDRDSYVKIHWENIQTGYADQFAKDQTAKNVGAYDIDSIMHYPTWAFSKNGHSTITRRDGSKFPDATGLSGRDIAGLGKLYP